MVSTISGISLDSKVEQATNLSSEKGFSSYSPNSDMVSSNQNNTSKLSIVDSPDVEVMINGEEKMQSVNSSETDNKVMTNQEAKEMSEALNDLMEKLNCNIQFNYHEKLGRLGIQMVDKQTKEVIKEFPPEEILKAMEKTKEWIGVFLDKKA